MGSVVLVGSEAAPLVAATLPRARLQWAEAPCFPSLGGPTRGEAQLRRPPLGHAPCPLLARGRECFSGQRRGGGPYLHTEGPSSIDLGEKEHDVEERISRPSLGQDEAGSPCSFSTLGEGLPTLPEKGLGRLMGEAELDGVSHVPCEQFSLRGGELGASCRKVQAGERRGPAGSFRHLVPQMAALTRLSCCPCTRRCSWC